MRKIGVVTVARSDYGIYRPVLRALAARDDVDLRLYVGGMHLVERFGSTVEEIERDGFPIAERIDFLLPDDSPAGVAESIGRGVVAFAGAFARSRPDVLVLLGDRFEMLAAGVAALPLAIPLAHIHGGELTEGAFDDSIRHALTKLSHLHFASAEPHARRIIQMGEEEWRVIVSGAPAVDAIRASSPLSDEELERELGRRLSGPTLLVTYHPATQDDGDVGARASELLAAIRDSGLPAIFTAPNADPGGSTVRELIEEYVRRDAAGSVFVPSLGSRAYHTLLQRAAAMVGNSSSGLIEAPSFGLPVVNVGIRQEGRLRAANVIDVADDRHSILAGIRRAVSPEFRDRIDGIVNPYGDGHAAERIAASLTAVELGPRLLRKRFRDADA